VIQVLLVRNEGHLVRVEAVGHAGWDRPGKDIVCASATSLLRSAVRACSVRYGSQVLWESPVPGTLRVEFPEVADEWMEGLTSMLVLGLKDLEREFPKSLKCRENGSEQEKR